jgi:hypothetical protein
MVNERLTSSTYSLLDLSLPSTGWLTIVVIRTCIVKVWIGQGMIFKLVPPFDGLTSLLIGCTIDGVIGTMLTSFSIPIKVVQLLIFPATSS